MKLLYIIDALAVGGKERQLIELLKGLETISAVQCYLVVLSDAIEYSSVNDLKIKINVMKRQIRYDLTIFYRLYKICKEFEPDIIHSWESMSSLYAIPIAKLLDIKFVNGLIQNAPSKLPLFCRLWTRSKLTFPFSDIILSNSYAGLISYKAPKAKSYFIHNGFNFSRVENLKSKEYIREKYKINHSNIVGMVGRFDFQKDYETFILAAKLILQKRTNVTFLAIGAGRTLKGCMKMAGLEFRDKIKFLGQQDNIESIINIFDIGVLATYTEGVSNAIMEYMSLEKPIVATRCVGTEEIVNHNKTGYLVEPKNVKEMAVKIEFLLDNIDVAKAMGRAGKEKLEREFGIDKMIEEHIKLYQNCLDTSHR